MFRNTLANHCHRGSGHSLRHGAHTAAPRALMTAPAPITFNGNIAG